MENASITTEFTQIKNLYEYESLSLQGSKFNLKLVDDQQIRQIIEAYRLLIIRRLDISTKLFKEVKHLVSFRFLNNDMSLMAPRLLFGKLYFLHDAESFIEYRWLEQYPMVVEPKGLAK